MSTTAALPPVESAQPQEPPRERLLVRWFVRFNPLFTLSALCVLAGVLVLSQHWRSDDPSVGLSVVVEAYQWLLIATAALLYRRLREHRPAAILGVIAVVFLVDPTLQLSALASSNHVVACVVWVLLVVAKLQALQWAFRLELSRAAQVLPVLLAAFVALLPNARMFDDVAGAVPGVLAVGIFALGALGTLLPITARSLRALDDEGAVLFARLMRAVVGIAVGGALFQGGNALYAMGAVQVMPAIGACLLVVAIRLPRTAEVALWICVYLGAGCCAMQPDLAMVLAASALVIASRQHAPRTFVAGVMMASSTSLYALRDGVTVSDIGHIVVVVLMTIALLAVLVRRRAWSAAVALVAVFGAPAATLGAPLLSSLPSGAWGVVLVAAGFALLPLGVYAHRRLARIVDGDDERLASSLARGVQHDVPSV